MKRECKCCGKSRHMKRVIDAEYGVTSERRIVCFKCQPSMDSNDYRHEWTVNRPLNTDTAFDGAQLDDVSDVEI